MQSDSVGVERRRLPFTLIENIILEDQALGPVDVLVYIALAKHADGRGYLLAFHGNHRQGCPRVSVKGLPGH